MDKLSFTTFNGVHGESIKTNLAKVKWELNWNLCQSWIGIESFLPQFIYLPPPANVSIHFFWGRFSFFWNFSFQALLIDKCCTNQSVIHWSPSNPIKLERNNARSEVVERTIKPGTLRLWKEDCKTKQTKKSFTLDVTRIWNQAPQAIKELLLP